MGRFTGPAVPRWMGQPSAADFEFVHLSGRSSVDFVATIGERWHRAFERLVQPADLGRWAVATGLVDDPPPVDIHELHEARRLRAAVVALLFSWGDERALPARDVNTINEFGALPGLVVRLDRRTGRKAEAAPSGTHLLACVARDAIELIGEGVASRLKECEAADCARLFYDQSRPGSRRWCSMQACGNRIKAARYRARRATQ